MGLSESKAIAKLSIDTLAKSTNNFLQEEASNSKIMQGIYVSNTKGDVIISGNKQNATVTVNMGAVQKAMSTQAASQKVASQVAQTAKALTQDLSIFNKSDAETNISQFINSTIDLTNNIAQNCNTNGSIQQTIQVESTGGNVVLTNNTQESLQKVYFNCLSDTVTNSNAFQDIQASIDQSTEAKTKGTDLVMLALIALLSVLAPLLIPLLTVTLGISSAINAILKIIFPLFMLVGVIFIVVYYTGGEYVLDHVGFSTLIGENEACKYSAVKGQTVDTIETVQGADKMAMKNKNVVAYDFKAYDFKKNKYEMRDKPQTTFYTSVKESECKKYLEGDRGQDGIDILGPRDVVVGDGRQLPTEYEEGKVVLKPGTMYIYGNTGTNEGDYQYAILDTSGAWEYHSDWGVDNEDIPPQDLKKYVPKKKILDYNQTITYKGPGESIDDFGDSRYIVQYQSADSFYLNIHDKEKQSGASPYASNIPGPATVLPDNFNVSAFKRKKRNPVYLYVGIGLTLFGIFGSLKSFLPSKKKEVKVQPVKK